MRKIISFCMALVLLALTACTQGEGLGAETDEQAPGVAVPNGDIWDGGVAGMVKTDLEYLLKTLKESFMYADAIDEQIWEEDARIIAEYMAEAGFQYGLYADYINALFMDAVGTTTAVAPVTLAQYSGITKGSDGEALAKLLDFTRIESFYDATLSEVGEPEAADAGSSITTSILRGGKLAYMRVSRFGGEGTYENDKRMLLEFYASIADCKDLIIDVRANTGSYPPEMWQNLIVAQLIGEASVSRVESLVRGGETAKLFNNNFENYQNVSYTSIENTDGLPEGIDTGTVKMTEYVKSVETVIEPARNGVEFSGNIYLLVDGITGGETNAFIMHAQDSGFAHVVGEQTAGSAVGMSYAALPATGLLVKFASEYTMDRDGGDILKRGVAPETEGGADALAACINIIDPTADADEIVRSVMPMNPIVTIMMSGGGVITAELYPEIAPNTVANFVTLIQQGFYDGTVFHRVIPGFMIQGGDPEGTGMGGPDYAIKGEFSKNNFENNLKHERGVLSMARSSMPDSAGSQFFIMDAAAPHLDGSYAAFGRVISGMEVVDAIVALKTGANDRPLDVPVMEKVTVETGGIEYTVEKLPGVR